MLQATKDVEVFPCESSHAIIQVILLDKPQCILTGRLPQTAFKSHRPAHQHSSLVYIICMLVYHNNVKIFSRNHKAKHIVYVSVCDFLLCVVKRLPCHDSFMFSHSSPLETATHCVSS